MSMHFFVYISMTSDKRYYIMLTTCLKRALEQEAAEKKILYIQAFFSMQEAIGYKLFLESLSGDSLKINIQSLNPQMKNLRPFLMHLFEEDS